MFSNQSNRTSKTLDHLYGLTAVEAFYLSMVNSVIALGGSVANALVIVSILLCKTLREKSTALLLVNLSVADFLVCCAFQPMYIYRLNVESPSTLFRNIQFRLGLMLQLASLNGLFVVTFDRFLYICYPLKYISWMTVPRCQTAIAMCWIAAFLLALTSLSTMSIVVLVPGYSAIGIIVILALHVAMFLTARKHARHVFQQFISLSMKPPVSKHRASKAVAMVFVSFLVCWMPVVLFTLLVPQEQEYFPKIMFYLVCFTSLNSVLSPFIFYWRLSEVRTAVKNFVLIKVGRKKILRGEHLAPKKQKRKEPNCNNKISSASPPAFILNAWKEDEEAF